MIQKQNDYYEALENILLDGLQDGSFHFDDPTVTTLSILGMCNWTYRWYDTDGRLTPEQISDIIIYITEKIVALD